MPGLGQSLKAQWDGEQSDCPDARGAHRTLGEQCPVSVSQRSRENSRNKGRSVRLNPRRKRERDRPRRACQATGRVLVFPLEAVGVIKGLSGGVFTHISVRRSPSAC